MAATNGSMTRHEAFRQAFQSAAAAQPIVRNKGSVRVLRPVTPRRILKAAMRQDWR